MFIRKQYWSPFIRILGPLTRDWLIISKSLRGETNTIKVHFNSFFFEDPQSEMVNILQRFGWGFQNMSFISVLFLNCSIIQVCCATPRPATSFCNSVLLYFCFNLVFLYIYAALALPTTFGVWYCIAVLLHCAALPTTFGATVKLIVQLLSQYKLSTTSSFLQLNWTLLLSINLIYSFISTDIINKLYPPYLCSYIQPMTQQ